MDASQLQAVGVRATPREQVLLLGQVAAAAGLTGLVCSAEEVSELRRELGASILLVVPGIRPAGAELGDQRRVATPAEALRRGASMLVVGRPITSAADPAGAAEAILEEMARELEAKRPEELG
jgi:orotidine-5'-phosphate decarboxylase